MSIYTIKRYSNPVMQCPYCGRKLDDEGWCPCGNV